jgi:ribosomal protein S18 acetylase RimI-like enzyme
VTNAPKLPQPPAFQLRNATEADMAALGEIHVQAWREAYAGMMPDAVLAALNPAQRAAMWRDNLARGRVVHLAERHGTLVGFGTGRPQSDASLPYSGEIAAIYVLRCAQRFGIGRALMAAVARDLLAQGRAGATLWVLEANSPARRFYEALGGKVVASREEERDGFRANGIAYGWPDLTVLT